MSSITAALPANTSPPATPIRSHTDLESGAPFAQAKTGTPLSRICASVLKCAGPSLVVLGGATLALTGGMGLFVSALCPQGGDVPCPDPFSDPLLKGAVYTGIASMGTGAAMVTIGETVKFFQKKMASPAQQQPTEQQQPTGNLNAPDRRHSV